jgi:uroporphyrinogen-III synthase
VLVDGAPVELGGRQLAVLTALVESEGRVLSRGNLLRRAWPGETADEHAVE